MKPEIVYSVECLPEDEPIEGNASAIDEETDRETVEWIRAELARGNQWAWCVIRVEASITIDGATFRGDDALGCCSYRSEEEFKRPSDYFDDMKECARQRLIENIKEAIELGETAKRALRIARK